MAVTKRRVRLGLTSGAVRRFTECRGSFGTDRRLLARAVQSLGRGSIVNYAVIFEQGESNLGAWVPDLPGCVAVGDALEEVQREIREAIEFHIESLRMHNEPVPPPVSRAAMVPVSV